MLTEERILVEVKMIKEKDSNETNFIEQLKADFESYHECKWLRKLLCAVCGCLHTLGALKMDWTDWINHEA